MPSLPSASHPVSPLRAFQPEHIGGALPHYWHRRVLDTLEQGLRSFLQTPNANPNAERQIFIIESCSVAAPVWRPLARQLAQRLVQRQLPVRFMQCRNVPENRLLGEWYERRDQVLILVFGDSQRIQTRAQQQAIKVLRDWPQLLWFELRDPRAWDVRTWWLLRAGLRVYPAQAQAVVIACQDLWREKKPGYSAEQLRILKQRRQPPPLPERMTRILGDALPWAQACAMLPPPFGLGLAEHLRQVCFPHLSVYAVERLRSLPDIARHDEALYFSPRLLALLRSGFAQQKLAQQEAVLGFLQQCVLQAQPAAEGLAHLEWQWYRARLQLDIAPEAALPALAELAQDERLKNLIEQDLAQLTLPTQSPADLPQQRIPLRQVPHSRQALRLLQQFAPDCSVDNEHPHPLQHWQDSWRQARQRLTMIAAFSHDGRWVATGAVNNALMLWDSQEQKEYNLYHHDWFIVAEDDTSSWWQQFSHRTYCGQLLLSFSPDNQCLATALRDNTVRIWSVSNQQQIYILKNHNLPLRALLFMPDSQCLLGITSRGAVWDLARGEALYTLHGSPRFINHAALSPDGLLLVTAHTDGYLRYWHSHSGAALQCFRADPQAIQSVTFSPDGQYLLCTTHNTAKLWEVQSGQLKQAFNGHTALLNEATFSPDSAWLVTASQDKTARIWNLSTGQVQQTLKHSAAILGAQFSPDAQQIAMVANDLSIQTYSRD